MRLPYMQNKMRTPLEMSLRSLVLLGVFASAAAGLHAQLAPSPDESPVSTAPPPKP